MKCNSCGEQLEGPMNFCKFCGVRAETDLRQIHYQNLGQNSSMPCPECANALDVIEFDIGAKIEIERCAKCYGMFFNPGEMQVLLDSQTNPFVWLDFIQKTKISEDLELRRTLIYRKCPICSERMSPVNFGGKSGVILDSCGTHGAWLGCGNLRKLIEWWRAGGKLLYQQNEAKRVKNFYDRDCQTKQQRRPGKSLVPTQTYEPSTLAEGVSLLPDSIDFLTDTTDFLTDIVVGILSAITD
jgi:Zn-finger nucleic acid-binding protein